MAAPLVAIVLGKNKNAAYSLSWILLIPVYIWVTRNNNKPLLDKPSVFERDHVLWYFKAHYSIEESYRTIIDSVGYAETILLQQQEDDYVYPLWVLFRKQGGKMPLVLHNAKGNVSEKLSIYPGRFTQVITNNATGMIKVERIP